MNNNLQSIIGNLEKGDKLELGNNEKFSNEIVLNQSLQCSVLGGINFINLTFKNIDFTGSFFSKTIFENCRFSNVIFRKSEFWSCTFLECQMKESNLTRAEFNSSTFKNCEFLNSNLRASNFMDFEFRETIFKNSNLDLILVEDVKVWKSDFSLPSKPNEKGRLKTPRTSENIEGFKDKIKKLVLRGERIEGTYRKSEPDQFSAIHFYDSVSGCNAIFKQETKEFVSAWKLTQGQVSDLLSNKNIGDY